MVRFGEFLVSTALFMENTPSDIYKKTNLEKQMTNERYFTENKTDFIISK